MKKIGILLLAAALLLGAFCGCVATTPPALNLALTSVEGYNQIEITVSGNSLVTYGG